MFNRNKQPPLDRETRITRLRAAIDSVIKEAALDDRGIVEALGPTLSHFEGSVRKASYDMPFPRTVYFDPVTMRPK